MSKTRLEHQLHSGNRRVWPKLAILFLASSLLVWTCTNGGVHKRDQPDLRHRSSWDELYSAPTRTRDSSSSTTHNVTVSDFYAQPPATSTSSPDDAYSYFQQRIRLRPLIGSTIARDEFEIWLQQQSVLSLERLLANVGDSNLNSLHKTDHVAEGAVVASPSKHAPDYFYQWIRDGAITANTIVTHVLESSSQTSSSLNITLVGTLLKYINNTYVLQRTDNPSGSWSPNLKGLGEPKWMVDNSPFTDNWGRPQNDGPPLRIITTLNFLRVLRQSGKSLEQVIDLYQQQFKSDLKLVFQNERELCDKLLFPDLNFIINNWREPSFDLWEEVNAQHFFTALCQLKAVKMGWDYLVNIRPDFDDKQSSLASRLQTNFNDILKFLLLDGGFLNPGKNYIIETPQILGTRSGLDIAVLIGSLLTHQFSDAASSDNVPFDVDDTAIMNSLHGLVKQMKILYPVNHQRANLNLGVALGRYPEDVYDGVGTSEGNPWFLATSAAAEVLYKLIWRYDNLQRDVVIPLDGWTSEFWSLIFDTVDFTLKDSENWQLVLPYHSPAYNQTMISLFTLGDSFLDKVREHVSDEGEMSEQFNKYTGYLQGARHLTWSYGAFWSSCNTRNEVSKKLNNS